MVSGLYACTGIQHIRSFIMISRVSSVSRVSRVLRVPMLLRDATPAFN